METGEIEVDHIWQRVEFENTFVDPVVIVKPLGSDDSDPAVIRVDAVDTQGFMVRIQEWEYSDGSHAPEKASYLVVERGQHQLEDGSWIEAGVVDTDATGDFTGVALSAAFAKTPVVFATVQTFNGADAVTTRLHNVDVFGFDLMLQEQEAYAQVHTTETVAFVAWEPSVGIVDGHRYEVGHTGNEVTHKAHKIGYADAFYGLPMFVAEMQTTNEHDTADLRWTGKGPKWINVWVDEEQSADAETSHQAEAVGYLLIEGLKPSLSLANP